MLSIDGYNYRSMVLSITCQTVSGYVSYFHLSSFNLTVRLLLWKKGLPRKCARVFYSPIKTGVFVCFGKRAYPENVHAFSILQLKLAFLFVLSSLNWRFLFVCCCCCCYCCFVFVVFCVCFRFVLCLFVCLFLTVCVFAANIVRVIILCVQFPPFIH